MTDLLAFIQAQPLFGMAITAAAYFAAYSCWRRFDHPALLHPVLVATLLTSVLLLMLDIAYEDYFAQAAPMNEILGLIIILLAVPLYRQFILIRQASSAIVLSLLVGSLVALLSAIALPLLSGTTEELLATLAPKSATAAVAVQVTDRLGGAAGLTAVIVISTGVFGAVFGPSILEAAKVSDERAVGFSLGVASHAIGTARAFQISEVAGAFASLGMILNALLTVALAPLVLAIVAP